MVTSNDSLIEKLDTYFLSDACGDPLSTSTVTTVFDIIRQHQADLVARLEALKQKLETGPTTQSAIMTAWDKARSCMLNDKKSDMPRMIFESHIDRLTEDLDDIIAIVRGGV